MTDEYRTPEEQQADEDQTARINEVLDQAVIYGTSVKLAMALGEPPEVVESWINTFWDRLRDGLSDDRPDVAGIKQEDRLAAILLLLDQRINDETSKILRSIRAVAS